MTPQQPDNPLDANGEGKHIPVEDLDAAPQEAPESAEMAEAPAAESAPEPEPSLLERYQRVCADYQNFQRRMGREMAQTRAAAAADVLRSMLPVLDDIDRAIAHAEQGPGTPDPMLDGVRLIREKFLAVLKSHDVREIPAVGERFDPAVHEALLAEPRNDVPPQTVIEVLQTGYRMGTRTLRPAKVKVSAAPPAAPPA